MTYVVVPLDGSELAERALPLAVSLAQMAGAGLRLVDAAISPTSLDAGIAIDAVVAEAERYLERHASILRSRYRLEVTTHATISPAVSLILGEVSQPEVLAVVMGTHGRSGLGRLILGSVAEGVLRESPIPVYLVPAAAGPLPDPFQVRHILVPLDGSALAYSVLAPLPDLARKSGARLTLVRIYSEDEELSKASDQSALTAVERQLDRLEAAAHAYFSPIKAHLRASGLMVQAEWSIGTPAAELATIAERLRPDLIALATHGRSGIDRLRYGSVAESVLRRATTPVMTLGPKALKRIAKGVGPAADTRAIGSVSA